MSPLTARNPNESDRDAQAIAAAAAVGPLFTEIDHVAIAVDDLGAALDSYREAFGAVVDHRELIDDDGVEEAILKVAQSYIKLISPTRTDSAVAEFLAEGGEGVHHVAYRVRDCAAALDVVRAAGYEVLDEEPRRASRGPTAALILHGTLIEMVEA